MIHPTDRQQLIELTEQEAENMNVPIEFIAPAAFRVHMQLADACADSARNWRQVGLDALRIGNTDLAIFAQKCAWDNERIAEEERGAR